MNHHPQSLIEARRLLVIKWGALGDLIAGTVAIRALREAYPAASITALSSHMMKEICPAGTLLDDVIVYDPTSSRAADHLRIIRDLRRRRFDVALNLRWTSERSALLALVSGARYRAGSGPKGSRWIYNLKAPLIEGRRHEFLRHLDIVGALGIALAEPRPFTFVSKEDAAFAESFLLQHGCERSTTLAVHPGASNPSKAWMPERFVETARRFLRRFSGHVLVTWGPGEEDLARTVTSGIGDRAVLSAQTTIGRLAALIARTALCLCNYSGVMNVGMAVETPVLALGCTSPEDWGPYGDLHRTVHSARPYDSYTDAERTAAMGEIAVDAVWEALETRYRELHSEHQTAGGAHA